MLISFAASRGLRKQKAALELATFFLLSGGASS
jgi:hypothetical protein